MNVRRYNNRDVKIHAYYMIYFLFSHIFVSITCNEYNTGTFNLMKY